MNKKINLSKSTINRLSILIADSGATKTDWCLIRNNKIIHRFISEGISPIFQSQEDIARQIELSVFPILKDEEVDAIRFYGTGCIPEKIESVKNAIAQSFYTKNIKVYSDLVAAAHSLCGHKSGIACILGTGSNSCEWNGTEISNQISPLGFILGDEGSGAHLGKLLVGDALKNQLSERLREKLLQKYSLTPADIIEKVYRQPFPSRFLATLVPFLLENKDDESIRKIIYKSFSDFFERNVMQYNYHENKVNFVGSVALGFADFLRETAQNKGLQIGKIEKSPMNGLIEYYKK